MLCRPLVRTSRKPPPGVTDSSSGVLVDPGLAATPRRCRQPWPSTRNAEIVPLPALAVYAIRPAIATQHAASWLAETGPESSRSDPVWPIRYDAAALVGAWCASEMTRTPSRVNPNPNGAVPADANERSRPIAPSRRSVTVSIVLEPGFVTARAVPAGLSDTWAGPASPDASGTEPPRMRRRPPPVTRKPTTFSAPAFTT